MCWTGRPGGVDDGEPEEDEAVLGDGGAACGSIGSLGSSPQPASSTTTASATRHRLGHRLAVRAVPDMGRL